MNGIVDKLDVNLVLDLEFDEVEGEHIVIGPYPQSKQDVGVLVEYGVNAVINLQTDVDMNHRGVLWARMVKEYRKCGVQGVNFQIHDFNQGDLVRKLPEAARVMRQFISQGMKVRCGVFLLVLGLCALYCGNGKSAFCCDCLFVYL